MSDLIDRQAAIDEMDGVAVVFLEAQKLGLPNHMDGMWFKADQVLIALEQLPSAQPEIVKCKDCKWKQGSECVRFADVRPFPDDYCSRAERKEA